LGVLWSQEKMKPFTSVQRYIGFTWDLENKTISLPMEKMEKVRGLIIDWLTPRAKFSASEA
ncbi:hypothetical protein M422DRAFT_109796, partial [Sphaerobolus stellatus SS14]